MKTLYISIVDKVATFQARDGDIVCGNSCYQIKFTFDREWDAHEKKTARFIWNGQFFDRDFTGDTCPVPIIQKANEIQVGVFAGDLVTTTPAKIGCKASILCGTETPSNDNDKYYVNEAKEYADSAAASAAASETSSEASRSASTAASTAATNAAASATNASKAAKEAKDTKDAVSRLYTDNAEEWEFEMEDGTIVRKKVVIVN